MRPALPALALSLVPSSPAAAAPGQSGETDPVGDDGYNAPDVHSVAAVWDGEVLGFAAGVTQTGLCADRFSVQIDANRDGVADYLLMLQRCEAARWMDAWNGSGWFVDIPQSSFRATYDAGRLQMYVLPQETAVGGAAGGTPPPTTAPAQTAPPVQTAPAPAPPVIDARRARAAIRGAWRYGARRTFACSTRAPTARRSPARGRGAGAAAAAARACAGSAG